MPRNSWRMMLWLSICLVLLCSACATDDTTDDDDDDDDDAAVDDDDDDNDATPAGDDDDDNDNDNDNDNDDVSPPPEPLRLLITGRMANTLVSWVQMDDGWRELDVPQQGGMGGMDFEDFGPIVIRNGRDGVTAINRYEAFGKAKGLYLWHSLGHSWLTFDSDVGWSLNEQLPPAGESSTVQHLQAPAQNDLWIGSEFRFEEADNGMPYGHYRLFFYDDLIHRAAQNSGPVRRVYYQSIMALSVPTPDYGLAWVARFVGDELWSFDGDAWTTAPSPVVFENTHLYWMWLIDADDGYALGLGADLSTRLVFEQTGGDWALVPPPSGCEEDVPTTLFATETYAVGFGTGWRQIAMWEKRGGSWQCRDLEPYVEGWYEVHAVLTQDDRAFVAFQESYLHPRLLELTADAAEDIALPEGLEEIQSVHALGAGAPPVSYSPAWFR
jgi:hypothetical protein